MPQFTDYPIKDLGKGIDTFTAPDNLGDGFMGVMLNMDPKGNGEAETRKGYQRYMGGIPLRANRISKSGTSITIEFDSSQTISLTTAGQGPLLLSGKLPSTDGITNTGDLKTSFNSVWYPGYTLSFRETYPASVEGEIVKTSQQTGFTSPYALIGISVADSSADASNTQLVPEAVSIQTSNLEVTVSYTAATAFPGFFYYLPVEAAAGSVYHRPTTTSDGTTISIPSSEHGLATLNFIVEVYAEDSGNLVSITPAQKTIDPTGTLELQFDEAFDGMIIIAAAPVTQATTVAAGPGTNMIVVPGITNPFNFYGIWATISGTKYSVEPAAIRWNALTSETTIEYYLGQASEAVDVFYLAADFTANVVTVEDTTGISETYSVESPQISVWGIDHTSIYKSGVERGGWINHVDSYRSELEEKLVCGLGGNLYQGLTRAEAGATYLMPEYRLRGSNRVSGDTRLGPLFASQTATYVRTRGLVQDSTIRSAGAVVRAIEFVSTGIVNLTLVFENKVTPIVLGSTIDTTDLMTVVNTGKASNSGEFKILDVISDSATETVIQVQNPKATSIKINESGISAAANVYTDLLTITGDLEFAAGDYAVSVAFSKKLRVLEASGTSIYLRELREPVTLPDGINLFVSRTSSILPLSLLATPMVSNIVRGDGITLTGLERTLTVREVNVLPTQIVTIEVLDGVGSVGVPMHGLNVEAQILLLEGPAGLTGQTYVLDVVDENTFTVPTTAADGSYFAVLVGMTVEVDEELQYTTGPTESLVAVKGRWVAIENPESEQAKTPETQERHFDENPFANQPYIKSSMITDSLFLTNGDDEVKKFDGVNLFNAGLVPWQAGLFMSVDTSIKSLYGGKILSYSDVSLTDKYFELPVNAAGRFKEPVTGKLYTILNTEPYINTGTTTYRAFVVEDIDPSTAGTGTLQFPNRHRYYAKVAMLDRNRNIITSATLGADDLYVDIFTSSTPVLKLVTPPAFRELDYDRIEIELYRTLANTVAPFYLVRRASVSFEDYAGYLVVNDTVPDAALSTADLDPTISVLTAGELGNQWEAPPKAEIVTSADNRLLLANIKSPPILDVTFRKIDAIAATSVSDYNGMEVFIDSTDSIGAPGLQNERLMFSLEDSGTEITAIEVTADGFIATVAIADWSQDEWAYLTHSSIGENKKLDFAGWYRADGFPEAGKVSFKCVHGRSIGAGDVNDVNLLVRSSSSYSYYSKVPVYIGVDGSYGQYRFTTTSLESMVALRLVNAINSVVSTDCKAHELWSSAGKSPAPWMRAYSGKSYRDGQLVIYAADAPSGEIGLTRSGGSANVELYVNNLRMSEDVRAISEIRRFGSRLVRSYQNFPEIFDDPYGPVGGDSVIDVDPADAQDIKVILPFFGSSTFGAAQQTQSVAVFKTNSVHLVNVATGEKQKLQTNGQGCASPRSVAATKDGILFFNRSGIYKLGWDNRVSWIGMPLKGEIDANFNLDDISDVAAHNYSQDRKFKLSYALPGESKNSRVFVYDHVREERGEVGSWTVYDNHDATGWANLSSGSFWGSTRGKVFETRNTGRASDYRDDAAPISTQIMETGGMEFGLTNQRKVVSGITYHLRNPFGQLTAVQLTAEQSLDGTYLDAGSVTLVPKENTVRFSLPDRKGTHVRLRLTKPATNIDEKLVVSKLVVRVAPIGTAAVPQQVQSK